MIGLFKVSRRGEGWKNRRINRCLPQNSNWLPPEYKSESSKLKTRVSWVSLVTPSMVRLQIADGLVGLQALFLHCKIVSIMKLDKGSGMWWILWNDFRWRLKGMILGRLARYPAQSSVLLLAVDADNGKMSKENTPMTEIIIGFILTGFSLVIYLV